MLHKLHKDSNVCYANKPVFREQAPLTALMTDKLLSTVFRADRQSALYMSLQLYSLSTYVVILSASITSCPLTHQNSHSFVSAFIIKKLM